MAQLQQGCAPWQKLWKVKSEMPRNLVRGKTYRGINTILLHISNYASPFSTCHLGDGFGVSAMISLAVNSGASCAPANSAQPMVSAHRSLSLRQINFWPMDIQHGGVPSL
jgi:hypothetical protein